jgi:hypothetical protein
MLLRKLAAAIYERSPVNIIAALSDDAMLQIKICLCKRWLFRVS